MKIALAAVVMLGLCIGEASAFDRSGPVVILRASKLEHAIWKKPETDTSRFSKDDREAKIYDCAKLLLYTEGLQCLDSQGLPLAELPWPFRDDLPDTPDNLRKQMAMPRGLSVIHFWLLSGKERRSAPRARGRGRVRRS